MAIGGTFGGYTTPTNPITAAAQVEILAQIDKVIALIQNPSAAARGASPDFDQISPNVARLLRAELAALKVAIDATAVS